MAYGAQVDGPDAWYDFLIIHNPTGIKLNGGITAYNADGSIPDPATRDQLFQTFLTRISGLANVTVSGTKRGTHTAPVTP